MSMFSTISHESKANIFISIKKIKNKYFIFYFKLKCLPLCKVGWAVAKSSVDFGREWFLGRPLLIHLSYTHFCC